MSTTATAPSARDRSFRRKVIYVVLIGLLLMPQFWLSHPATRGTEAGKGRPGGKLALLRAENGLNQAELGQIDPTSETIRLATLGMRGVAVSVLWHKAIDFQTKKDWTSLRATLEQISKLQPHSTSVWRYQAWNLSYNVSVAFDDYHDKYYWIIEGVKFMQRGVELNEHESKLPWDVGWFIAHKIGKADEAKQFRRLFKADDQFHGALPLEQRDNWLVGKTWFHKAEECVDERHPVRAMAPVIFWSDAPLCQFYYAEGLENDGRFGELAVQAWKGAENEWTTFGDMAVPTSYDIDLKMNDQEKYETRAREAVAALDAMAPGTREKIKQEKLDKLSPEERKAWETPEEKRNARQNKLVAEFRAQLDVTHEEVARRGPSSSEDRKKARKLADEAAHYEELANYVRRERAKVNFDYWRLRAVVEQTPDLVAARKLTYEADQQYAIADLRCRASYDKAFVLWRKILDRYEGLRDDASTRGDLMDVFKRYLRCLRQRNEVLPEPFILQDVLDRDPGYARDQAAKKRS